MEQKKKVVAVFSGGLGYPVHRNVTPGYGAISKCTPHARQHRCFAAKNNLKQNEEKRLPNWVRAVEVMLALMSLRNNTVFEIAMIFGNVPRGIN